jgi:Transcriptional regulator PadR-like family
MGIFFTWRSSEHRYHLSVKWKSQDREAVTEIRAHSFLPLKSQWFHIMLSLAGGEQHGYGIMQDVLDRTTGKVRLWPATLYGSIKRLIEADLIEESANAPRLQRTTRAAATIASPRSASSSSTRSANDFRN